jgi:Protein of unknown function (DUF4019)
LGRNMQIAVLIWLSFLSLSCNMSERVAEGKQAVNQFHDRLNSEQYTAIYADTDQLFRKQSTEKNFTAVLSAVHKKLGVVKQSDEAAWRVNTTTHGTFVTLSYRTKFSEADATESFTWRVEAKERKLVSYNVSSSALVLK